MSATLNNLFSGASYSTLFYNKKTTIMLDILEELKYRTLYCFIAVSSLVGLVYLNYGLYVEFLWSYYLDYYKFIDFCWYEGIRELNHMQFISSEAQLVKYNSWTSCFCEASTTGKYPILQVPDKDKEHIFANFLKGNWISESTTSIQKKVENALQKTNDYLLPVFIDYLPNAQQINYSPTSKSATTLLDLVVKVDVVVAAEQPQGEHEKQGQNVEVEVDEFKQLFISILSCFSGQLRWTFDLSSGNSIYSKIQDGAKFFNICFIFLFYQVNLLLVYHIFCFITPGIFQQSRLRLLKYLQIGFLGLSMHYMLLPHVVSISEEFAHESVDSELFFSTNFNFLSSWIYCFYLLVAIVFILYAKIVTKK